MNKYTASQSHHWPHLLSESVYIIASVYFSFNSVSYLTVEIVTSFNNLLNTTVCTVMHFTGNCSFHLPKSDYSPYLVTARF